MRKSIIGISIAILFKSVNAIAQTQAANEAKHDLMNDNHYEYIKKGLNGNNSSYNSSSNASKTEWYDSKTETMKKGSVDEMCKQVREDADKTWTDAKNDHNERKRVRENRRDDNNNVQSSNKNSNTSYTKTSNYDKTLSSPAQSKTEDAKKFKISNERLRESMKGMSFSNTLKLKGIESHTIKNDNKDNQTYNSAINFTQNKQLAKKMKGMSPNISLMSGSANSHSVIEDNNYGQSKHTEKNSTNSELYYADNGDIYFGIPFEFLPEQRKKQLLLAERQKSMVSYSNEYKEPTFFEALNNTFVAPIRNFRDEICAYISMTPQEIWTELKYAVTSETVEDFYDGVQTNAKKMPLKESINYVSGKIKKVIASTGETGNILLNNYELAKKVKDVGDTNQGILIKTFSALYNCDIGELQFVSNKLPNEISTDVYKLARRNVPGMPNVPVNKEEIQSSTANLFIKKVPNQIIEKTILR